MATGTERTIGQLVADATHDLEGIVRGEIALAKAEVTSGAKVLGKGAGMLAGAAFCGLMGLVFVLHGLSWVIAEWLPVWAGYLIVAAARSEQRHRNEDRTEASGAVGGGSVHEGFLPSA